MNDPQRILFTANSQFAVSKSDNGPTTLKGYAVVWNAISQDRGGYRVRFLPNSAQFLVPSLALYHHSYRDVLGSTENQTLRIKPDEFGVKVEIDLPNTQAGRDAFELVDKKYVKGMSFGVVEYLEASETLENGQSIRNVGKFTADEVTVTVIPAFTETSIATKQPGDTFSAGKQEIDLHLLRLGMLHLPARR